MTRRGFTLVEVLVAMVVMEIGLLGVVGTLVLAARTVHRADVLERMVTEAGRTYDSVWSARGPRGPGGPGGAALPATPGVPGRVRWSLGADGALQVDVVASGPRGDSVLLAVGGRTFPPAAR